MVFLDVYCNRCAYGTARFYSTWKEYETNPGACTQDGCEGTLEKKAVQLPQRPITSTEAPCPHEMDHWHVWIFHVERGND